MSDPITRSIGTYLDIPGALHRIGDEQAMRDVLLMMAELLATDIPRIDASLKAGDLVRAAGLLHSLKGCIPIFCTLDICSLVVQSEQSAKSGDLVRAETDYRDLKRALEQLENEINRYFSGTPSGSQAK